MSIVYERRQWEPVEAYYFKSTHDHLPICVVTKCGDHWELRFIKGSANPGPFPYSTFEKAKSHVLRYLEPREEVITGGRPSSGPIAQGSDTRPPVGLKTTHPSRKPRRPGWWKTTDDKP